VVEGVEVRDPGAPEPRVASGITFQLPKLRDPRLHVAAVVVSVQVLGQVSLGFDLSIAQILVCLITAATIELALTAPRTRVVAWPASALLTGNGIALILRVPGTEHGDWWSMRGWYVFAATTAVAVLSKYVIRWGDRPLFNPSNFGLVLAFLVLGSGIADPQDLWWGPMSVGLALTYVIVVVGGIVVTRRLHLLAVSAAFWVVFAALMGLLVIAGHSMTARWNLGPVAGWQFWTTLVLSPEVLIFVFFMITDPRTGVRGRAGGVLYGAAVAVTSAVLIAFQTTEYATKVALLAGLVVVCALRPVLERLAPATSADGVAPWARQRRTRVASLVGVSALAIALVLAGEFTVEPAQPAVAAELPEVVLTDEQRPDVDLGAGLAEIGGSFGQDDAERVAAQVVTALLLADSAVAEGNTELAGDVATGPFRADLSGRPVTPAPERTVDHATVDVVRDPDDFQAQPRLAVTLTGTADGADWTSTFHVLATTAAARIEREVPAG
jgi:hypothetical protein